jgi:5-deoxy-glucuronate isomerase
MTAQRRRTVTETVGQSGVNGGNFGNAGSGGSGRRLHWPAGSLASPPWELNLSADTAGWSWSSLRVLCLAPGASHSFASGEEELLVLSLAGSCHVTCDGKEVALQGRTDVFEGPSDFVYLPRDSDVEISSLEGGRFAVAGAKARRRFPVRYRSAEQTGVELRGAGSCSRRVVNYAMTENFDADRILVCEVVTPSGNWSSYPPHKHDESRSGETELEEIYYFAMGDGPGGDGIAYQRVYGTEQRPIEFLGEVRDGDVVLIPHGYHGPSMASPGYDLYFLNVMAGPNERTWLASDDPRHAWVRASWAGQEVDPRLSKPEPSAHGEAASGSQS